MPIAVALSLLVQVTCAFHVVRTGRDKYWLMKRLGRQAQTVFAEILRRAKHAPGHYRRTQREWIDVANANISS